jgi:hypothetical protein
MQAGPARDLMRAISSRFGAKTKTWSPAGSRRSGPFPIGEVDVSTRGWMQIVAAAKGFRVARGQQGLHPSRLRIEFLEAVLGIGDQNTSVRGDFKSVGPARIRDHERPFAAGHPGERHTPGQVAQAA